MTAQVLRQGTDANDTGEVFNNGHYEYRQDPDSGAIIKTWVEDTDISEPGVQTLVIPCMAKAIATGGVRGSATTEVFKATGVYEKINYINLTFPEVIYLSESDRITNIKSPSGMYVWTEDNVGNTATVFNVEGVLPITDPFGRVVEKQALLKRAGIQI